MQSHRLPALFRRIVAGVLLLSSCPLLAQPTTDSHYFYDPNGQLVRTIDASGKVVTYTYDAVGNLLSRIRATTADLKPPAIASVNPTVVNQGESVEVVLTGTDFLLGTLTTNHPGLTIANTSVQDTKMTATLIVAPDASLGPAELTVTTSLGTGSNTLTVIGPLPKVVRLVPSRGPADGGTPIAFFGTDLTPDTTLTLGGNPATDVVFIDAGTLTAKSPAGQAGLLVDVGVSNGNGSSTHANGFSYLFSFSVPGAVSVVTGGTATLTVTRLESQPTDTTITLMSTDPTVATVPPSAIIPGGGLAVDIPVVGLAGGVAFIPVTIGTETLTTTIFVTPPFSGEVSLTAIMAGASVQGPPFAPIVATYITPSLLPSLFSNPGDVATLTLNLSTPAPAGGLCATIASSNPAVGTVPPQVCIAEGEATIAFSVTAIATGNAVISASAGGDLLEVRLQVAQTPEITTAGMSAPVGTRINGPTLAPVAGLYITPSLLPALVLENGDTGTVTLNLVQPAPAGGLCVTIASSNPSVGTVPNQVCINEGEQTVSFSVATLASGTTLIQVVAGDERFGVNLLVDQTLGITGAGLAAPVGTWTNGPTLAPVVGMEVK